METNFLENNNLTLVGKITEEKKFSHEIYGEKFYTFGLSVPRLSGNADVIPITISERLFKEDELVIDKKIRIRGQFRSYNTTNWTALSGSTVSHCRPQRHARQLTLLRRARTRPTRHLC